MSAAPLLAAALLTAEVPVPADPGSVAFAADLYRAVAAEWDAAGIGGAGWVLSPESVRVALAVAYAGAEGETAAELDAALRPPAGGVPGTLRALAGGGAIWAGSRTSSPPVP